jgi:hypothetical protein
MKCKFVELEYVKSKTIVEMLLESGDGETVIYNYKSDLIHFHHNACMILRDRRINMMKVKLEDVVEDMSEWNTYEEQLRYITSGEEYKDFLRDTQICLDNFRLLGRSVIKIDHSRPRSEHMNNMTINDCYRLEVIRKYLEIASTYINFQYYPDCNIRVKPHCISCSRPLGKIMDGEWHCPCGFVTYKIRDTSAISKGESEYRPESTFVKELTYFQGRENIPLPEDLHDKLDVYFRSKGIFREEVLKSPLDSYGKRKGTSLRLVVEALKAIGYPTLYKRANSIGRDYFGWQLLNLDPYMDDILHIYRKIQKAYKKIPRTRKSNINTQGTLYRILRILGLPVRDDDFKLCTTYKSNDECELLWRKTCELAKIPYHRHF